MDTGMKKLFFLLLALTVSAPAFAQTQTQYYTVPTIAALKAMTTSRPAVVQVVDANPGIFNLSTGACSAADDIFQVQPTAGTTVCYTRAATPYSVGKSATVNGVMITNGTGVPSISTTLPAVNASAALVTSTGSTTARALSARFADTINVLDHGAVADSCATNNATAIQAAITLAAASGKGVFFPSASGTYCFGTSITLASNVVLYGGGSAHVQWNGGASPMFTSSSTTILYKSGLVGFRITSDVASVVVDLKSPYQSIVEDLYVVANSATAKLLSITTNASGGTNPDGNRNAVFVYVENIVQEGTIGTFVYLSGIGVGSTPTSVVTLNTFNHMNATGVSVRGYDFAEWVDSNYFSGVHRVSMIANNGVGAEFNTAAPTSNRGVYANKFDHLAVDTFGVMTGRIGVKMNYTKHNKLGFYFNEPVAEGGDFVIDDTNTVAVDVFHQKGGTNDVYNYRKLIYEKGAQETLVSSSPFSIRQTWNNAGVVFNSFEIDNTDTTSSPSSTLASWKVASASKFNFFKDGTSIQTGGSDIGYAPSTGTSTLGIGRARSGDGISNIDLISDTTYTSGGLRLVRYAGANGASSITHRGTNSMSLVLPENGSYALSINGGTVVSATASGVSVTGTSAVSGASTAASLSLAGTLTAVIASTAQTNVACYNSTSGLFTYQTAAAGCAVSSARFKENITVKSNADALKVVASLEPVKFQYKASAGMDRNWHDGFIAEQVAKVAPDLVEFDADGKTPRAVKYQELAPYFAGAIRELKTANDNLKAEIAELKRKMK